MKKILILVCAISLVACKSRSQRNAESGNKYATIVTNHSDKNIIIETLHSGYIKEGIYKITIDSNIYILSSAHSGTGMALAMQFHGNTK
jgi:uncharacterized protein YpmS